MWSTAVLWNTAVDVKRKQDKRQLMWSTVFWECMSFASFFWCSLDVKQTKTDGSWCKTQQSCKAQNSWCWFWFLRSSTEREFTAEMSQHMFWRATSKMSERKTSGGTTVETSQVQCLAELFFLFRVCVRVETVSVINRLIAPQSHGQSTYTTAEFSWHGMLPWDRYDWSGNGAFAWIDAQGRAQPDDDADSVFAPIRT